MLKLLSAWWDYLKFRKMITIFAITFISLLAFIFYARHQCRLTKKQHERIKKWVKESVEK